MQNDMELINREDVLFLLDVAEKHLREIAINEDSKKMKLAFNCMANMFKVVSYDIGKLPTIDAVPVVRCKDCKCRYSSEFCECRPEDAFCSDGERRE